MDKLKTSTTTVRKKRVSSKKAKVKTRMDEVFTKAAVLFREFGYQKTTMNDIAQALDIQKSSLYYYVNDKETLLYEILNQTLDMLINGVKKLDLDGLSPVEKLHRIINEQFKNVATYKVEISLLVNEMKNLQPKLRHEITGKRKQYEEYFLEIIREGFSRGAFVEHNQHVVAFFILGGAYWFHHWFSVEEINDSRVMTKDFIRLLLNGLASKRVTSE